MSWNGVPRGVRRELEPLLKEWRPYCPRWLVELRVQFEDPKPEDESPLAVDSQTEYGIADLYVYPDFLRLEPDMQRARFRHEAAHLPLEPLYEVFHALLDATVPDKDDPLRLWATRAYELAMEGCVTDQELGLGRMLNPRKDGHE